MSYYTGDGGHRHVPREWTSISLPTVHQRISRYQYFNFSNILGPTVYGLLRSLVAPDKPKSKSLASLKDVLRKYYEPKKNIVAERFFFHRRKQHPGETVADYLAELHRIAARCSFPRAYLDEVLRDRFICGLCSEAAQKLLAEDDVKLQRAVEVAKNAEAVHKHALALKTAAPEQAVGVVGSSAWSNRPHTTSPKPISTAKPCYRCAKVGHFSGSARTKTLFAVDSARRGI